MYYNSIKKNLDMLKLNFWLNKFDHKLEEDNMQKMWMFKCTYSNPFNRYK